MATAKRAFTPLNFSPGWPGPQFPSKCDAPTPRQRDLPARNTRRQVSQKSQAGGIREWGVHSRMPRPILECTPHSGMAPPILNAFWSGTPHSRTQKCILRMAPPILYAKCILECKNAFRMPEPPTPGGGYGGGGFGTPILGCPYPSEIAPRRITAA